MLNTATVTKLQEMHLSAMAGAFQKQLQDPSIQAMYFLSTATLSLQSSFFSKADLTRSNKCSGFSP